MFQNSNAKFIVQLSQKNYKINKNRNIVSILAIVLTSFMLITVFTVGASYISSYQLQQLQLLGTTGDAMLNNPSQDQINILKKDSGILKVGVREEVIQAGKVEFKEKDSGLYYGFRYYDEIEWNNHRRPVLNNIVGSYPERQNDIMIPTWVLEKMGVSKPKIGFKYGFLYEQNGIKKTEKFVLSGYFEEYDNSVEDGTVAYLLVSKKFMEFNKNSMSTIESIADVSFDSKITTTDIERMEDKLVLQDNQEFKVNPNLQKGLDLEILIVVFFAVFCIIVCGYLLIYNIFSISIKNNIHYYGQLKVIGITKRQIRDILLWQAARLTVYGTMIGSILGYLFSGFMVPIFLSNMLESKNPYIKFNIWVVVGTILFTGITVFIAVLKPAAIAGKISPIQAIHYEKTSKYQSRKQKKRKKPTLNRMAFENVIRDKKRFYLVVLSMVLGFTSCLTIATLVSSMNTDNYIESNMESDIELKNRTASLGYTDEMVQVFNYKFLNDLRNIKGVESIKTVKQKLIAPQYKDELFGNYISTMISENDVNNSYFEEHPESFYSQIIGMSFSNSIREAYQDIDWNAFDKGETCLIPCESSKLFPSDALITFKLGNYDSHSGKAILDKENYSIKIGGLLPESYNNYGIIRTVAPHIIVSQEYLNSITKDSITTNVIINTQDKAEKNVNNEVISLVKKDVNSDKIVTVSALEKKEELQETKITLYGMGGSLAVALALIGVINFINVIYAGISERRKDFNMMESIGFEKRQIIQMVVCESLIYYLFTMISVLTIGNVILYFIYKGFSNIVTYAKFSYPILLLFSLVIFLFGICYFVPKKAIIKNFTLTIVERLNMNE